MAKKSKEVVVPLLLTKKSAEVPKISVGGLQKIASSLRSRAKQIADLEAAQKAEETVLLDKVKKERIAAEKKGNFVKTCLVQSEEEDRPVRVTFANKFSKIASENEPVLRECLSDLFDELYKVQTTVRIRDDISPQMLKDKLGEEMYGLLFTEEKFIGHRDEFLENRARLRMKLNNKTMEVIDQLTDQCISKPSVSVK